MTRGRKWGTTSLRKWKPEGRKWRKEGERKRRRRKQIKIANFSVVVERIVLYIAKELFSCSRRIWMKASFVFTGNFYLHDPLSPTEEEQSLATMLASQDLTSCELEKVSRD